ncbi:P-loop containing nucleoside triphosphate hydrolase protein [Pisolithus albus]|nr:P-loop containing nucleoside triphosphate hydrolase protein [Pisolithus albus]
MGPTGSGKSNFINKLTGSGEEPGAHRLESCTQGVREFTVNVPGGTRYVFVDTPGFDDTHQSDCDVLRTIADWLDIKYRRGVKLAGVVYTHRISDSRMSNAACKNLDLFCHLCGDKAAQCVRMVTTMWDSLKSENSTVYRSRLSQLEGSYWKPLIGLGARHEQFFNTQESAWHIVHGLVQTPSSVDAARKMEGGSAGQVLIQGEMVDGRRKIEGGSARQVLLIQEEMVDAWKELNETSAGQALYSRFQEVLLEYKKTLKKLADALAEKDPSTVEQLRADYCKVEAQMQKVMKDREGMKISLRRRIASFLFGRKTRSRKIELNLTPGDLDTNQVN